MLIRDLQTIYLDKFEIYTSVEEEYKTLYKGEKENIPAELLDRKVRGIAAKRKGLLDIWIY